MYMKLIEFKFQKLRRKDELHAIHCFVIIDCGRARWAFADLAGNIQLLTISGVFCIVSWNGDFVFVRPDRCHKSFLHQCESSAQSTDAL